MADPSLVQRRRRDAGPVVRVVVMGLVLALTAGVAPASSMSQVQEECVPSTREEAVRIVTVYFDAFIARDRAHAEAVPLADDARRSNIPTALPQRKGGPVSATSGEQVRTLYTVFPVYYLLTEYGGLRLFLDGCTVVARMWLNVQVADGDGSALPAPAAESMLITAHVVVRFRISNDLIEEMEVFEPRSMGKSDGSCWPAGPDPTEGRTEGCARETVADPLAPVPGCIPASRSEMIAVANTYLQALPIRDGTGIALAAGARRTEIPPPSADQGPLTGTSAAEIRESIRTEERFGKISALRNVRWFVEEGRCQVIVYWLADEGTIATRHHMIRFMVSDGLIYEIENLWAEPVSPGALEGSCWPKAWSDAEDETYRLRACPAVE